MYSKNWLIIKDDSKRTYEICGQSSNANAFTNKIFGMQRAGMNVSFVTPPVTNKSSSKEMIAVSNYTKEEGLHERLLAEFREITMRSMDEW
jgi:hypothetical protein